MQTDLNRHEFLNSRVNAWDQDLRWGHRGVEQITVFLQEVQRHLDRESQLQGAAQGLQEGPAEDSVADSPGFYSREDLEMEITPLLLAKFRQMAKWYLLRVPALLELIDRCEATLHPDDVAGPIKREAAREFPCALG